MGLFLSGRLWQQAEGAKGFFIGCGFHKPHVPFVFPAGKRPAESGRGEEGHTHTHSNNSY